MNPAYLEGGRFIPGTWQRVRIPLIDFGVLTQGVTNIGLGVCGDNCKPGTNYGDDFYIDDIQLVGAKP